MRRIISLFLALSIMLTGCVRNAKNNVETPKSIQPEAIELEAQEPQIDFDGINDPRLIDYLEDDIYSDIVTTLNSDEFFVENVEAVYISKEYIEELSYNSQSNIYFGYTLAELDALFEGARYVFTLGDNGKTTVKEFEKYDDSYETILKNIAIGSGVILVCVTVSVLTQNIAPAVSMIFAVSARSGTIASLSSGVISSVSSGIVTGIETKDFSSALKSAAVSGSEGFKWGAIIGTLSGGASETISLYGASRNGLTMSQAALIQKESNLPLDFIKNFHSIDEYYVYKNAGLKYQKVNGKWAYTQDIDWDHKNSNGITNAQLVAAGKAPVDNNDIPYELHHIGQMNDSPLAILTNTQHHGNHSTLHANSGGASPGVVEHGKDWEKAKDVFWESFYSMSNQAA